MVIDDALGRRSRSVASMYERAIPIRNDGPSNVYVVGINKETVLLKPGEKIAILPPIHGYADQGVINLAIGPHEAK